MAVDAVREARARGIPAYYYHGDSMSSVCIGTWPKEAVRGDMEPAFNDPTSSRSAAELSRRQPADVVMLPPGSPPMDKTIRTPSGATLRTVSPTLEVVDPGLLSTMQRYNEYAVNGEVHMVKGKDGMVPQPSALVPIPRRDATLLNGAGGIARRLPPRDAAGDRAASAPPRRPAGPGQGQLRSLGGN
jgi:hypothetical protein